MSEYLHVHDKIQEHAMKQARRNHSVFPRSIVQIFRPVVYYLVLGACGIQESDVKIKGTAVNYVAIASAVSVRFQNTKASALHYRMSTVLLKLTTKYSFHEKCLLNAFCKQASNVLSGTQNFKTFDHTKPLSGRCFTK